MVIELNEPQVWTLIGVFAAATFGLIGIVTSSFMRVMNVNFQRIDDRFAALTEVMNTKFELVDARFAQVDARLDRVDARLDRVDARLDQVNSKIDHLDRDVQTLFRRVFPEYPDAG